MAYAQYKPTRTVYHYCSEQAFRSIVSTKQLRFSDLFSSNDPREYWMGYESLENTIALMADDSENAEFRDELLKLLSDVKAFAAAADFFVCCFSEAIDSLPMWQAYGGSNEGYAIGFRPRALLDMHGRIQKVEYIGSDSKDELRKQLLTNRILRSKHSEPLIHRVTGVVELTTLAVGSKHLSWSHEAEVRIVYSQSKVPNRESVFKITSMSPTGQEFYWQETEVASNSRGKVLALHFSFGKWSGIQHDGSRAIQEVIIGPKNKTLESEVVALLLENGYSDFVVRRSHCAIR